MEEDVAYKIWENDSLYPSLSHYLTLAETTAAHTHHQPIKHDSFLREVLASYAESSDRKATPENIELNLRQAMQVALSQNRDVQLALLAPAVAESELKISQTVYDPSIFSDTR